MATLTGQKIKDSYKDLLQVSNSNSGIDGTLRTISDGEATDSVLQLSSSAVNISSAGALQYAGTAITSTAAELNILDGVTASTAELNILDGVTSTAAELNILDGATVTVTELNYLDGADSSITTLSLPDNTTITTFGASLVDDADAATARTTLGVDAAGTDNSTNVTLVTTSHDYLSISGQAITLGTIDISDDTNLVGGTGITLTGDTLSTTDSEIVHDSLSGFVANEHINHSSVSISAGTGLSGGGDLTTTRTLSTNDSEIVHDNLSGFVGNEHIDHSGVTITAGSGLTGGGDITTTRTLNVGAGTHITVNADDVAVNTTTLFSAPDFTGTATGVNLTLSGDLTVNGTTTTINSTTVTVDDPIFTLGGDTAPASDDNKDRGIEFRWHNGSAAKVGFFGYDDSAEVFTFIQDATNTSEVFSGSAGNVAFGNIAGTLTTASQTNITGVGALNAGSITSGFGAIDNGSSNITTTGTISFGSLTDGSITIADIKDEDDLISDSATSLVTQQSVKAYIDAQIISASEGDITAVTAGDGLTGGATSGAATLNVGAGTGIDVAADAISVDVSDFMTNGADNRIVTATGTDAMNAEANLTFDASSNLNLLSDSGKLRIGADNELEIYHDGTNDYIDSGGTAMFFRQGTTEKIKFNSAGNIQFNNAQADINTRFGTTGSTNTLFIDGGTDRVGIGTNSPTAKLDVRGNVSFFSSDASDFVSFTHSDNGIIINSAGSTSNKMFLRTGGSDALTIDASQNVGIGTSSPAGALHIVAAGLANHIRLSNTESDATTKYGAYLGSHYTNSEEPVTGMLITSGSASATGNLVTIGGGISSANAVNIIRFYTAANKTTLTGTERMRIDNSGNVGIGTNSPTFKFDVTQSNNTVGIRTTDGTSEGVIGIDASANVFMGTRSNHNLVIRTNNSEVARIGSNGNVGIGTSSPDSKLQVEYTTTSNGSAAIAEFGTSGSGSIAGSAHQVIVGGPSVSDYTGIQIFSDTTTGKGVLSFADGRGANDNWRGVVQYDHSTNDMEFWTDAAERMKIDSSGNVGIGNVSPGYKLDVAGQGKVTNGWLVDNGTTAGFFTTDSDNVNFGASTSGKGLKLYSANTEAMKIDSSGNVGVGTSSPSFKLKVNVDNGTYTDWETIAAFQTKRSADSETEAGIMINSLGDALGGQISSNYYWSDNVAARGNTGRSGAIFGMSNNAGAAGTHSSFYWQTSPNNSNTLTDRMMLDSSGRLLIGDTSANYSGVDLQVGNTSDSQNGIQIQTSTTGNGYVLFGDGTGASAYRGQVRYDHTNDSLNLTAGGTETVYVKGGNVGIGETSIDAKLHLTTASSGLVNQKFESAGSSAWRIGVPAGQTYFAFDDSSDDLSSPEVVFTTAGNVGINTSSPAEKLDVNGNIRIGNGGGLFAEHSGPAYGGTVIHPNGGTYRTNTNSHTGAIKITLPTGTGTITDMISFWVDVFDYNTNESFTCYIAGYAYQTAGSDEWVNEEALILSSNENRDFIVRFGHDGSNHCVYIGELTSGWNYPQITIRNVQIGFSSDVDAYNDGWSVGFESSAFQNVDHTQTDNFPYAKGLKSSSNMGAYIDGNEKFRFTTGGAFHATDDVIAFSTTPSDKKLKTNVKDIDYGLDTIMKLKPKQYDWKKDNRKDIGFIAQEVEEVIPEIVKDNEWFDDKIKTMDYEKLTAVLIKAVQEQQQQINELKEKLNG